MRRFLSNYFDLLFTLLQCLQTMINCYNIWRIVYPVSLQNTRILIYPPYLSTAAKLPCGKFSYGKTCSMSAYCTHQTNERSSYWYFNVTLLCLFLRTSGSHFPNSFDLNPFDCRILGSCLKTGPARPGHINSVIGGLKYLN